MIAAPGRIFTQCPSKHNAALGMRPEHRHMETQPRHAAAQVTLLEVSFVFLPGLRRGGNPSSEQHRQAPKHKCCCRFARSSSGAAAQQRSSRAACSSSSGAACSNSSGAACSNSGGAIERRYRQRSLAYCSQRRVVSTCDGEESASASSSCDLQAAAAASGERQQQRRAALCKLAHQALKQTSIRSHHQRLCSRPEHSCGNDHCKTSATQMRGRLAATFYGCAQGR